MKIIATALGALLFAGSAEAVVLPSHVFEFSGNAVSEKGDLAMTPGTGASYVGAGTAEGGMRFTANQGPLVSGAFANPGVYSMEMFFSFDALTNYRRIVDLNDRKSDNGLYLLSGDVHFFGPVRPVDTNYQPGQMLHIVLTRDEDQVVRGYGQGAQLFSFSDTTGHDFGLLSGPDGLVRFFRDDTTEASAGFVDFIRLYDRVLTDAEVAALYGGGMPLRQFEAPPVTGVPEPASWAMLILGFGGIGAALRRRRPGTAARLAACPAPVRA